MAHVLRNIINSVTDLEKWKAEREKHEEARKDVSCKLRPYPFLSEKMGTLDFGLVCNILCIEIEYSVKFILSWKMYESTKTKHFVLGNNTEEREEGREVNRQAVPLCH